MKVLIIHPYRFPEYKGGAEVYTHNLEMALSKYVNISQINNNYFRFFGEPLPNLRIFKIIKSQKPDIIHLQGPRLFATITGIFGRILKTKTVLTYHANLNPKNFVKKIVAFLDRAVLKYIFDYLIVTSESYREKAERFFSKEKIKVLPLGIKDYFFQFTRTKGECRKKHGFGSGKIVLFIGKLDKHHYYKGADILIKAAKFLPEGIEIILIGDGDRKKEYEKMVIQLGLVEKIKFVPEMPPEDLMEYYRAADVLVLPSISDSEGFGFVLLEAMAIGLPTITTELVGSANLIKERRAGLVIPAKNPGFLAESIKNLLSDSLLYKSFENNGREFAKQFSLENSVNQTLETYQCLAVSQK